MNKTRSFINERPIIVGVQELDTMAEQPKSLEQTLADFRRFLREHDEPIGLYPALEAFIATQDKVYVHQFGEIYAIIAGQELSKLKAKADKKRTPQACNFAEHKDHDQLRVEIAELKGETKALRKFAARFPRSVELEGIDCHIHKYLGIKDTKLVFPAGTYHIHGQFSSFLSAVTFLPGTKFIIYDEGKFELLGSTVCCKGTNDKPVIFNSDGPICRSDIEIKGCKGDLKHLVLQDFITLHNVLRLEHSNLRLSNLTARNNYCDRAILVVQDGSIVIEDSDISDNYTTSGSGCVIVEKQFSQGGAVAFNNCRFTGNQSRKGAVHVYEGSTARFDTACVVEGNTEPQISGEGETIYDPKIIKD